MCRGLLAEEVLRRALGLVVEVLRLGDLAAQIAHDLLLLGAEDDVFERVERGDGEVEFLFAEVGLRLGNGVGVELGGIARGGPDAGLDIGDDGGGFGLDIGDDGLGLGDGGGGDFAHGDFFRGGRVGGLGGGLGGLGAGDESETGEGEEEV